MSYWKCLWCVPVFWLGLPTAEASHYLEGRVTINGQPYKNTSGNVYLQCSGPVWASDWAQIDSQGHYEMKGSNNSYNPCSSSFHNVSFTSCEVYAYPIWSAAWGEGGDSNVGPSDHIPVSIDCNACTTKDIPLKSLDDSIAVQVTAGGQAVTSGVTVYCSEQESPWLYRYSSRAVNGTYRLPVAEGNYSCSAYCSDYANCLYAGYPNKTVSVTRENPNPSTALNFALRDKTIDITLKSKETVIASGMSVSCYQTDSPWTSAWSNRSDGDSYPLHVTAGRYRCNATCDYVPYGYGSGCLYTGVSETTVTVLESDTTINLTFNLNAKDKKLRVTLKDNEGSRLTTGMTVYASQQGGGWSYDYRSVSNNGVYELAVAAGRYYVSAYCNDYLNCEVSGYPSMTVEVEDSDTAPDIALTFFRNNATISGVVTADRSGGIAGAGVSVYAYTVSEDQSSSRAGGLAALRIIESVPAAITMVSRYVMTEANGSFQMRVPAGNYTVSVWPPWMRADLGSTSTKVTAAANSTTALRLALYSKSAKITGKVTDAAGRPMPGVSVSGWSYNGGQAGTNDWFWTLTDRNGEYSNPVIDGLQYNVSAYYWSADRSNTRCQYNVEGVQTVVASSTLQSVNFTYPFCSCEATIRMTDGTGNLLTSISGGVSASPVDEGNNQWTGVWGNISGGTTTLKVHPGTPYRFQPYVWDSDYVAGEEQTFTCTGDAATVNFPMVALDASIHGCYLDANGDPLTVNQYSYLYVSATKGNIYRSCETDEGCFNCKVSKGRWCLGYWVDPASGFASSTSGTSSLCLDLEAGNSVSQDIGLQRTGTIQVSVLKYDRHPAPYVWVNATSFSNQDRGANDRQYAYMGNGCMTGVDGKCSLRVGAARGGTAYSLNATVSYEMKSRDNTMDPKEVKVTVLPGKEVAAELIFRQPDGTSIVTVTKGSTDPVAHATVDCFSSSGGSYETETDEDGIATCRCTSTTPWKAVAYVLTAREIWQSEAATISCSSEESVGTGTLSLNKLATIPEKKSATVDDVGTDSLTLELKGDDSSFFSVFFPSGSLGTSGQATCQIEPTVTPFTANLRPASYYGYRVNCQDGAGAPIIQLNSNATFTMSVDPVQVENVGLTMRDVHVCFYDDAIGAYNDIESATIDQDRGRVSYQQNHLTAFAVVGNGNLAGLTETEAGPAANEYGEEPATGEMTTASSTGSGDTGDAAGGGDGTGGSGAAETAGIGGDGISGGGIGGTGNSGATDGSGGTGIGGSGTVGGIGGQPGSGGIGGIAGGCSLVMTVEGTSKNGPDARRPQGHD